MALRECNDKRRLWKYIIFGILTLGIYDLIFMWNLVKDLNSACGYVEQSEDDKSPNYIVICLLTLITLGIYNYIWYYKQGNRLKAAGKAYGLEIAEKGSSYILWQIFGLWLFGVGPIVALYFFICNTNKICRVYNYKTQADRDRVMGNGGGYAEDAPGDAYNYTPPQDSYNGGYNGSNLGYDSWSGETNDGTVKLLGENSSGADGGYYNRGGQAPDDIPTQGKRSTGRIECLRGMYSGAVLELHDGEEILVGRNSTVCQLVISDPDISRRHCTIKYSALDGYYYVTDHSSIGVYMNNSQRLTKDVATKCAIGTTLSLGNGNNVFALQ